MTKRDAAAPMLMEDFAPFYLRKGLLYVPYLNASEWHLHVLAPQVAVKGVGYVGALLGQGGQVIDFTVRALKRDDRETTGHLSRSRF